MEYCNQFLAKQFSEKNIIPISLKKPQSTPHIEIINSNEFVTRIALDKTTNPTIEYTYGNKDVKINFTIETVTMGCYEEDCIDDPYCHECPLTPAVSLSLVIGEQYPNMLGDANLDGDVNIVDIIEAINFILYVEDIYNEGNMFLFNLINMNDDNTINILDVILMVDYILSN